MVMMLFLQRRGNSPNPTTRLSSNLGSCSSTSPLRARCTPHQQQLWQSPGATVPIQPHSPHFTLRAMFCTKVKAPRRGDPPPAHVRARTAKMHTPRQRAQPAHAACAAAPQPPAPGTRPPSTKARGARRRTPAPSTLQPRRRGADRQPSTPGDLHPLLNILSSAFVVPQSLWRS